LEKKKTKEGASVIDIHTSFLLVSHKIGGGAAREIKRRPRPQAARVE
jgi:hypothetical protein